jgi:predicted TIM-barrel fold metal-dependent hydrolase
MDYYGVDYALASHFRALQGNPMLGNELLIDHVSKEKRLFPCWYMLPPHTGETPSLRNLAQTCKRNNVRAVRIPLGNYNVSFCEATCDELFSVLQENRTLTILHLPSTGVPVPDRDDFYVDTLYRLCMRFPDLSIVAAGRLRGFYPVLEKCSNLYFSLEWDPHPNLIEDFCKRFGAQRLLFGTPYCENAKEISGMSMMMVCYADISDSEREMIAGKNLAALLGLNISRIKEVPGKRHFQDIHAGKPLKYAIYDIHAHIGAWSWEYKPGAGLENLFNSMERIGARRICINSTEAVIGGNHYEGNAYISSLVKKNPERLTGFAVINPNFNDVDTYTDTCIRKLGFKGIKIHPRVHQCAIEDERYRHVWKASEKHKVPVLCHTGEGQAFSEPDQFNEIASRYPEGLFILGHTGETLKGIKMCIELACRFENLFLDISGWGFMKRGYLEYLIQQVDTAKILFGSDYSWIDFRYAAGIVIFAEIDEQKKQMILSSNASELLHE